MNTPLADKAKELYVVGDFVVYATERAAYRTAIRIADTRNMPVSICCRAKGLRDTIRPASAHPPTQQTDETQLQAFARMQVVENARAAAAGRMPRAMND